MKQILPLNPLAPGITLCKSAWPSVSAVHIGQNIPGGICSSMHTQLHQERAQAGLRPHTTHLQSLTSDQNDTASRSVFPACRFLFKDQYIEFTTNVPEDADLYGLGEVTLPTGLLLPRNGRTITMWARDFPCAFPDVNLYGSHPFYLQVNKGAWGPGQAHNSREGGTAVSVASKKN